MVILLVSPLDLSFPAAAPNKHCFWERKKNEEFKRRLPRPDFHSPSVKIKEWASGGRHPIRANLHESVYEPSYRTSARPKWGGKVGQEPFNQRNCRVKGEFQVHKGQAWVVRRRWKHKRRLAIRWLSVHYACGKWTWYKTPTLGTENSKKGNMLNSVINSFSFSKFESWFCKHHSFPNQNNLSISSS